MGCQPWGVKVDHSRNIWAGCAPSASGDISVLEYGGDKGSSIYPYFATCPGNVPYCASWLSESFDEATNGSYVFAGLSQFSYLVCNGNCTDSTGAGFLYWSEGNPSASPTLIQLADPYAVVYYLGLDSSGNIWFDFGHCLASGGTCKYGLGEIQNPTTPTYVEILRGGSIGFLGGVYTSSSGSVLNVTDQTAGTVSQYTLPVAMGAMPFNVLTTKSDTMIGSLAGAAYTPSDK